MRKFLAFLLCLVTWPVLLFIVLAKAFVFVVAHIFGLWFYLITAVCTLIAMGLFVAVLLLL